MREWFNQASQEAGEYVERLNAFPHRYSRSGVGFSEKSFLKSKSPHTASSRHILPYPICVLS